MRASIAIVLLAEFVVVLALIGMACLYWPHLDSSASVNRYLRGSFWRKTRSSGLSSA
jgi:hypothetical protein